MAISEQSNGLWLHRYAVLTACATFLLIVAGALVASNDAGLSVPDWPLSYGKLMPPMVGGIKYEHSHRMVAATVGMLTIGLAVWLGRREPRRWVRRLGYTALATVIAQGILGGITVLYFLPPAVSIAHACLAQFFFCCTVSLALFTSPGWINAGRVSSRVPGTGPPLLYLAAASAAAVYCQLILGAAVRHSVLGVMPHVLGAAVATVLGFATTARIYRRHGELAALRRPALLAGFLLLVQIGLGLGAYLLKYLRQEVQPLPLDVSVTTAHVACGALLLGLFLMLALRAHHLIGVPAGSVRVFPPAPNAVHKAV